LKDELEKRGAAVADHREYMEAMTSAQIYYVHPVAIDTTIKLKLVFSVEILEWMHNWTAQWCMMKRH